MRIRGTWVGFAAFLVAGCGGSGDASSGGNAAAAGAGGAAGGGAGAAGAGGAAGGGGSSAVPAAPTPALPALPLFAPCPGNWTETKQPSGAVTCEPGPLPSWTCPTGWLPQSVLAGTLQAYSICAPPPLPATCPAGTMPVVGQTTCQPVGTPCPAGSFAANLPATGKVLYVKPGATGTGAVDNPFGTIAAAMTAATSGAVIALATGTYVEDVTVSKAVTLWGACVTGTTIQGSAGAYPSAAVLIGAGLGGGSATVTNLGITGLRPGLVLGAPSGDVTVKDVWIHGVPDTGLGGRGTVHLQNVSITDTGPGAGGVSGTGIYTAQKYAFDGHRVSVERSAGQAISALDTGTLSLEDVVLRKGKPEPNDSLAGDAVEIGGSASVTLTRAIVDANLETGLSVLEAGAKLTLVDAVVSNTQVTKGDGTGGDGIDVQAGAASLTRCLVDSNRSYGLFAATKATVSLKDVVIRGTTEAKGGSGVGVALSGGSTLTANGVLLLGNGFTGIYATDVGTSLTATDLIVSGTKGTSKGDAGLGLFATKGSKSHLTRALFDANHITGVAISGADLDVDYGVVRGTLPSGVDQTDGRGFSVEGAAHLKGTHVLVEGNHYVGGYATLGGTLELTDAIVQTTVSQASDGARGFGLAAQYGAAVTLTRAIFDRNRAAGVNLSGPTTTASLTDVSVLGTTAADSGEVSGGIYAEQAGLTITRALVEGNEAAGLFLVGPGQKVDATDLTVRNTLPRAKQQDYGLGALIWQGPTVSFTSVRFEGNATTGVVLAGQEGTTTSLTMSTFAVLGTKVTPATNGNGMGIVVQHGGIATFADGVVSGNQVAGFLADGASQLKVSSSWIAGTTMGSFVPGVALGADGTTVSGVGDGVLVLAGSTLTATGVNAVGCARAGFLVDGSQATFTMSSSHGNVYGLVSQNGASPAIDPGSSFTGNTKRDNVSAGNLAVPNSPLAVPPVPPSTTIDPPKP